MKRTIIMVPYAVLAASFTFLSLWAVWIDFSYDRDMPRSPEPQNDRTHEMLVHHGDVRYVTHDELSHAHFVLETLRWPTMLSFFGMGLLKLIQMRVDKSNPYI
jgi:hypothetical protein